MRQFLLSVIFLLMACASAWTQTTAAANRADPAPTFGACTAGKSIIIANLCTGADLGIKINAADAALGSNAGEIWVYGGGSFAGSIAVISSNHILRMFPGTYTATGPGGDGGYIWLKDNSALICSDSSTTILQEPTGSGPPGNLFAIVKSFGQTAGASSSYGTVTSNLTIKGCHFKGTRTDASGAYPGIDMGNCHNCEVSYNWFDGQRAIGIAFGHTLTGSYAYNSSLHHNLFKGVEAVNAAIVNGENISFKDNKFYDPGSGFGVSAAIDVEPNTSTNRIAGIDISNNFIDVGHSLDAADHGIAVTNNAGATIFERVFVKNNIITGSRTAGAHKLSIGIQAKLGARDVHIIGNEITFGQSYGIYFNIASGEVRNNYVFSGGNGIPIELGVSSANVLVSGNHLACDLGVIDSCSQRIINSGAASNVITGNLRTGAPTIAAGTGAGTSPTVTITGDSTSGYIDLTTGSASSASATVVTVTFPLSAGFGLGNIPNSIPLSPANSNAAALSGRGQVYVDLSASSGTSFVIKVGATRLAAHTKYIWFYGPVKQ